MTEHEHEWVDVTALEDSERTLVCVWDTPETRTEPWEEVPDVVDH